MKKMLVFVMVLVLSALVVLAHGANTSTTAENIIKAKTPCSQLTDDQLEDIGDYYMEQMHPGKAHGQMDDMMGGEGSESLKQMHLSMARSFYCGEHGNMSAGMMKRMMGSGMMGSGMMRTIGGEGKMAYGLMGSGMMGSGWGWIGGLLLWLVLLAAGSFVFAWIFWATFKWMVPQEHRKRRSNR